MSRPKPTVILSYTAPHTGKTEQILAAEAIYAVFHDGKPVNLKSIVGPIDLSGISPKYKKTSFANSAHAFNLAQRLNDLFQTDKFAVHRLTIGEVVEEISPEDV